jgi:predicted transcriptional regulator
MQKVRVQEVVEELPENVDLDALIERLYVLRRLELAEEELAEGKVVEHEEVEKRMAKWLD